MIKYKVLKNGANLIKKHSDDAGWDVVLYEDVKLHYGQRYPLGLALELPKGTYGQLIARSSVASRERIWVSPNVIDSNYRGEIELVIFWNRQANELPFKSFKRGDRVAQLVVHKIDNTKAIQVDELSESTRGDGGFGSTNGTN